MKRFLVIIFMTVGLAFSMPTAQAETTDENDEPEEEEETLTIGDYWTHGRDTVVDFFSNDATQTFAYLIAYGIMAYLIKKFIKTDENVEDLIKNFTDRGREIKSTYDDVKEVLSENEFLKNKVDLIEKKEDTLLKIFREFVQGTKIDFERKMEIAKLFDQLIEMDEDTNKEETKSTVDEYVETEQKDKDEKDKQYNKLKNNLDKLSDDEETD